MVSAIKHCVYVEFERCLKIERILLAEVIHFMELKSKLVRQT